MENLFFALALLASTTAFAHGNSEPKKFCSGIDGDKVPLATKVFVTCETNPQTVENIMVKYCYLENDNAKWSQNYPEYDPEGC